MKFYGIPGGSEDGTYYVGTLTEAKKEARRVADFEGYDVDVERHTMTTDRANLIRLANGRGWCSKTEIVFTAKPRRRHSNV